jgi:hypothetical protein
MPEALYAAVGLMGVALLAAPLRAFPISRLVALGFWSVALVLTVAAYSNTLDRSGVRVLTTIAVIAVVVAAVGSLAVHDFDAPYGSGATPLVVRSIATSLFLGAILAVSAGLDATGGGSRLEHLSSGTREGFLLLGISLLSGAITLAAASGFLRGVRVADRNVRHIFRRNPSMQVLRVARPPNLPARTAGSRNFAKSLAQAANVFAVRLVQRAVDVLNVLLRILSRAVYLLKTAVQATTNLLHKTAVFSARALNAGLRAMLTLLGHSLLGARSPLSRWGRSLFATTALIGLASGLAVLRLSPLHALSREGWYHETVLPVA